MKKYYQILGAFFSGIFLLAGCQGQTPVSQSAGAAASSAVSQPSTAVSESVPTASSTPQPTQEWGTAGIGDTITVAGVELTLETFTVEENKIIIGISHPSLAGDDEALKRQNDWKSWVPDTEGWTGGGVPYLLVAESEDATEYKVAYDSLMGMLIDHGPKPGLTLTFRKSTWDGGELPANPTYHLSFADETGIIPGFTFS